jgi:hypothetical protein
MNVDKKTFGIAVDIVLLYNQKEVWIDIKSFFNNIYS